jgi:cyclophilin family peptidyl-prolyl cis-trans isomerase
VVRQSVVRRAKHGYERVTNGKMGVVMMKRLAISVTMGMAMMLSACGSPEKKVLPIAADPLLATPALTPENTLYIDLSTGGTVKVQLRPDVAPENVTRIKTLVQRGFYNGLSFHRVIPGFMAQGGDPLGNGTGGSDLPDVKAEFSSLPHVRGVMSMARANDPNSANSQFFIMLMPRLSLDKHYTIVGRVISGMPYVDAIAPGEPPPAPSKIVKAYLGSAAAAQ